MSTWGQVAAGSAESKAKVKVAPGSASAEPEPPSAAAASKGKGVLVDQVIAVVNGDLVLESDVDEERRFVAFQPVHDIQRSFTREQLIERLIDRDLILQQAKLQPDQGISDADVSRELLELRKTIPACKEYHCDTDAGWERFVHDQGFTLAELQERWKQRMEVLSYIEYRFRNGIVISPDQIKQYYEKSMLPEYAKAHTKAPPLDVLSSRIQEVLLQQQVSSLLADWLKTLRAEGSVRVMKPGEVTG